MDDKRLKSLLTQRAEQGIPDTMDLRDRIHLQIQSSGSARTGLGLRRAVLIAVLLLMTATAAYALYQTVIQPDPGIEAVQNQNLVVQLDQTQTVEPVSSYAPELTGIDVTLDYAYADVNRITVAYSVAADAVDDAPIDLYANPTLTDSNGNQYLWLVSSGQNVLDSASATAGGTMSFDASIITDAPDSLDLTLQIDVAYVTAADRAENPAMMRMAGKTTFSFSLPFNPGQTVAVDQSVTASDLAVEVRQIVIAPSLTRADVCYDPTNLSGDSWLSWEAVVSLDVDGERIIDHQPAGIDGFRAPDAPCRAITTPASLVDRAGEWTLTIHEFHNTETGETLDGDWSYTFTVE